MLAVGGFLYHAAENFEFEEAGGRIGPGAWPKMISLLLLALGTVGRGRQRAQGRKSPKCKTPMPRRWRRWSGRRNFIAWLVWLAVAATVGYLVIMPLVGFFLATIVYSFVLIYLGQYRQLLQVTLLSVAIAFGFMFMFMRVVYVALPVGIGAVRSAVLRADGRHRRALGDVVVLVSLAHGFIEIFQPFNLRCCSSACWSAWRSRSCRGSAW